MFIDLLYLVELYENSGTLSCMGNETLSLNKLARIFSFLILFISMIAFALYLIFSFYSLYQLGNHMCFIVCHISTHVIYFFVMPS